MVDLRPSHIVPLEWEQEYRARHQAEHMRLESPSGRTACPPAMTHRSVAVGEATGRSVGVGLGAGLAVEVIEEIGVELGSLRPGLGKL